jgi:hypothetical protein
LRRTLTLAEGIRAQSLRRLVRHKVTCAFCGRRYLPRHLRFAGYDGKLWLFLGACSRCGAMALIGVVLGAGPGSDWRAVGGPSASGTDGLAGQPAVTAVTIDDVLDLHDHLASFDGDFHRLFRSDQLGAEG